MVRTPNQKSDIIMATFFFKSKNVLLQMKHRGDVNYFIYNKVGFTNSHGDMVRKGWKPDFMRTRTWFIRNIGVNTSDQIPLDGSLGGIQSFQACQ